MRAACIGAALALVAGGALAQFGGGMPGGGMGRQGGMRGGMERPPQDGQRRPEQAPQRSSADIFQTALEELRVDLKLDALQTAAWNTYVARIASLQADLARERSRAGPGTSATPPAAAEQLERIAAAAQNRATAIEEVVNAAKALNGILAPEQKAIADARLAHVTWLAMERR